MAERTMVESETSESGRSGSRDAEWAVAKTLLDANAHTVQAFEYHLLRAYREDASPNLESIQWNLEKAIEEHERIIDELEAAEQAVAEMRDERNLETFDE